MAVIRGARAFIDPFVLALAATVILASIAPATGPWVRTVDRAGDAAVMLLFFLQGAKLSRAQIMAGAGNWRLHIAVFAVTFGLFPLFGLVMSATGLLDPIIAVGILFLTLLPSTVQSSIAFTSIARGNVAATVCSASFSNLLGIFLTPALALLLMGRAGTIVSARQIETVLVELLIPFLAGHVARPMLASLVGRHRSLVGIVDRGSILLVVYGAFGAAVRQGIWHLLSYRSLLTLLIACALLLAAVLGATWALGRLLKMAREDRIALLFCGSKKSLVAGVPMAALLFAPTEIGPVILPLMLFHQIQLVACAVIARTYASRVTAGP